jgi:RsiW-degrading membrane proteinase PrsW (M82 family)
VKYFYFQDDVGVNLDEIQLSSIPYQNYIMAIKAKREGQYEVAKDYLIAQIAERPTFDNSYEDVLDLCRLYLPEDFKKLASDPSIVSHLSLYDQRFIYFANGDSKNYLSVITERTFRNIDTMAFLAALLISIVWMIFLRSLDVYNKERWIDLTLVFLLGALFTNLCLIGYDFFHWKMNFHIDGTALNDFWYCVIVIGGSEELVKFVPWVLFIFLARKAKEPFDYLLYASISALGFAFVENFVYLENPGNIVGRSIMSTISHMFDASIIAYAMILARYKIKKQWLKFLMPLIGFAVAMLCHGFYDFWLISDAFPGMEVLTIVFFIITLQIWFFLHNNAINNSPFYKRSAFNSDVQLQLITIGIIGILMAEYSIIGIQYGASVANAQIGRHGWMVVVFLSYMTAVLANIKIMPGVWKKYKFSLPNGVGAFFRFSSPFSNSAEEVKSYEGLELRLFVQKSNRYVADLFPVSGKCMDVIELSNDDGWHVIKLNKPLNYVGYANDKVVIRTKDRNEPLDKDKVEIILLFIPRGVALYTENLKVEQLRFTGRAFARPIN